MSTVSSSTERDEFPISVAICSPLTDAVLRGVSGKYPPAEPGALGIGPLKAAGLDPKPHLCGPRRKHSLEIPPQPVIQFFLRLLENKYLFADILRPTCRGFKVSWSPVEELPFVCVVAHGMEFIDGRLP